MGCRIFIFRIIVRPPKIALDVLLINDGTGHFTDESQGRLRDYRNSGFGTSIEIHDMDGDGDQDIIKSSSLSPVAPWGGVGVFVLFNDGKGAFEEYQEIPTASPYMFTMGDLTNDGRLDSYIVNDGDDYVILTESVRADGPEPLTFGKTVLNDSPPLVSGVGMSAWRTSIAMVTSMSASADVDIDIGICETAPDALRKFAIFRNEGMASGQLVDPYGVESSVWNQNVFDFVLLDVDRDGKLDIFAGLCEGYGLYVQGGALRPYPAALAFDGTIAGSSEVQRLRLCNNAERVVTVDGIDSVHPSYEVTPHSFTLEPYGCIDLEVRFSPSEPGSYPAKLTVRGDEPLAIAMEGRVVTPPSLTLSQNSFTLNLLSSEEAAATLVVSNDGGSALDIELTTRIEGAPLGSVLAVAAETVLPAITGALDAAEVDYASIPLSEIAGQKFAAYELIILGLVADPVTLEDMERLAQAVHEGATLMIWGGTTDVDFESVMNEQLLAFQRTMGWQMPDEPHFQIATPGNPLVDGLPFEHTFESGTAAWYLSAIDDLDAVVAGYNSDRQPALASKVVGDGRVIYFVNWPPPFRLASGGRQRLPSSAFRQRHFLQTPIVAFCQSPPSDDPTWGIA